MKPFDCFNLSIQKSNRQINRFYQRKLSKYGVSTSRFSVLRAIYYYRETNSKELQSAMLLDQTTLSRQLGILNKDELIHITLDKGDSRVKKITLSTQGEALYMSVLPVWNEVQHELKEILGANTAKELLELGQCCESKLPF